MSEKEVVMFKPYIGCLLTHQPAWQFIRSALQRGPRDIYECVHCKTKFFYPTKQDENPVYRKF